MIPFDEAENSYSPEDQAMMRDFYFSYGELDEARRAQMRRVFYTQRIILGSAGTMFQQSIPRAICGTEPAVSCPLPDGFDLSPELREGMPAEDGEVSHLAIMGDSTSAWCADAIVGVAFSAETGVKYRPDYSNSPADLGSRSSDFHVIAVKGGRIIGKADIVHKRITAMLQGQTDGSAILPEATTTYPISTTRQVVANVWVASNFRRAGVGAGMIRVACDLMRTTPERLVYGLPFSPGGMALVHRVTGGHFRAAAYESIVIQLDETTKDRVIPPDRTIVMSDEDMTMAGLADTGGLPTPALASGTPNRAQRRAMAKRTATRGGR